MLLIYCDENTVPHRYSGFVKADSLYHDVAISNDSRIPGVWGGCEREVEDFHPLLNALTLASLGHRLFSVLQSWGMSPPGSEKGQADPVL